MAATTGELIAFLDSDDYWLPGKPRRTTADARRGTGARRRDRQGQVRGRTRHRTSPGFRRHLTDGEHMAPMPGTLLVGRAVFDQVGVFDEAYCLAADVGLVRTGPRTRA